MLFNIVGFIINEDPKLYRRKLVSIVDGKTPSVLHGKLDIFYFKDPKN